MAKLLKLRRGTTTQHDSFTGAEGEVTVDLNKDTLVVHDGTTQKGHALLREDLSNLPAGQIDNADIDANAAIANTKIAGLSASATTDTTNASNISSGTINDARLPSSITSDITGNAASSDTVDIGTANANQTYYPVFTETNGSAKTVNIDGGLNLTYNPGTNTLETGHFKGSGSQLTSVDATTLDSLDSTSFLRSDAADTSSGQLTLSVDATDALNFSASSTNNNRGISFNSKTALSYSNDSWLRLNNASEFGSGVYTPLKLRADGGFEVDGYEVIDGSANIIGGRVSGTVPNADTCDGQHLGTSNNVAFQTIDLNGAINSTGGGALYGRNHAYDTVELRGYGAEFMLGAQHQEIHINYRTCNNGNTNHTPVNWYWRAGSNSNWSNHNFGNVTANGSITATGNVTAYSDARLKTNVNTINDALSIVGKLRGVSFDWKESGKHSIGVIAQEVETVLPELVQTNQENIGTKDEPEFREVKSVDYGKIVGVLINAINELKAEVEELKGGK